MTIRWGIIGCGDVTEVKSGPGFQQAEGSALVAVMRRDGAKAEDYARRHSVPYWFDRAEAVIHHPEVDAVYIATPPGSHRDYALLVCAAGKPAYIEKPMARNHAECEEMVAAFTAANQPLFVAYYRRGLARFLKAKEIVESGKLGTITQVSYRFSAPMHRSIRPDALPWRVRAEEAGGGIFLDLACHTLDILDFILGPLENVEGDAANLASSYDVEDTVVMRFRAPSGAFGVGTWNFAGQAQEDHIVITGTTGRLTLSTFGNEPVHLETAEERPVPLPTFPGLSPVGSGPEPRETVPSVETFDLPNPRHIQQPFIQTIVDELDGKGVCPSTGVTAARTSKVIDTVLAHYYDGRDDAFWIRPETWPGRRV
jgi:1,5-anhydro-D-fructose reductase (1,5-anhydro-D-mannitol-forming)